MNSGDAAVAAAAQRAEEDEEEEEPIDLLPPMPEHSGLVKMQLTGAGVDEEVAGVWRKVHLKLVSNVISFYVAKESFSRLRPDVYAQLFEVSAQTKVEDCDVRPLCLQITSGQGLVARICTLSDGEWGEWKINLKEALHSAIVREREASVLRFRIRRCLALDADTKHIIPPALLQHKHPRIIKLYTALGQIEFGRYGIYSIKNLQVGCLWNNRHKFVFREDTTNNTVPLFSVSVQPNDWDTFNAGLSKMFTETNTKLRRDFTSETEKAFWDLFLREHPTLDPWG